MHSNPVNNLRQQHLKCIAFDRSNVKHAVGASPSRHNPKTRRLSSSARTGSATGGISTAIGRAQSAVGKNPSAAGKGDVSGGKPETLEVSLKQQQQFFGQDDEECASVDSEDDSA